MSFKSSCYFKRRQQVHLKNISPYLKVIANSYDGLPEAVAVDTSFHPFIIAVQFHPERLGTNNPIHKQMRASFFNAIAR